MDVNFKGFGRWLFGKTQPRQPNPGGSGFVVVNNPTTSGVPVDQHHALTLSSVWACVTLIADVLASKPWVISQLVNGTDTVVPHNATRLLTKRPNSETTAFDFWRAIIAHILLWGNAYAEIQRTASGRPVALWLITPDRVRSMRDLNTKELFYRVTNTGAGGHVDLSPDEILHFAGLGWDGVTGYSVIRYMAETVGMGLAVNEFGAQFFGNGTHLSGVLSTSKPYNEKVEKNIINSWREAYTKRRNQHKTAVLMDDFKWQALGIPPEDSQFLETRKLEVTEVCRWFRVPPHMVQELTNASTRTVEEQGRNLTQYTFAPWTQVLTQEVELKLIEDDRLTVRILLESLHQATLKDRYAAYSIGRQWGFLTVNDVRSREGFRKMGPEADILLSPLNMIDARLLIDENGNPVPPPKATTTPEQNPSTTAPQLDAARAALVAAFERVATRELHRLQECFASPRTETLSVRLDRVELDAREYAGKTARESVAPVAAMLGLTLATSDLDRFLTDREEALTAMIDTIAKPTSSGEQNTVLCSDVLKEWSDARPTIDAVGALTLMKTRG